jgi:TolB-like protein/DNA-binding winged helix-turn-helix (wHTH) protein/Flp pilus assembly protein TadD
MEGTSENRIASYLFDDVDVDCATLRVKKGNGARKITPRAFEVLVYLLEHRGRIVEKQELFDEVWKERFVTDNALTRIIKEIRQVIGDDASAPRYIETIPKRGYCFSAEVTNVGAETLAGKVSTTRVIGEAAGSEETPPASDHAEEKARERPPFVTDRNRKRGQRTRRWQMAAISLVALVLAAIIYVKFFRGSSSVSAGDIKSLAVLPLENLSGDPSQEYFADGMTDALIGDLAKIRGLQVISRTSSMHYKGANKPLREIASELGVEAVVEGTVQRSGDRIQVRAQLIHAATDRHLWAETYERDLRDVLALQSEIAHAIVREIQIKIMPSERARLTTNRPVNRKAFDDYLQGRFLYFNRYTIENLHTAVSFFNSAIAEDPAYAPAYVGLSDCYNSLGTEQIGALPPMDARRQAEEAAREALKIDNELSEAHVALGFVKHFNWDWAEAEQEFKHAIELNPNNATAHQRYGGFLVSRGRMEEAIAEANRAQELDPFSLGISAFRGFILENARHYDEAIEQFRRVIAMDQSNYSAYWFLGHTYAANRQFDEAITASERAVAISRTPGALGFLGMNYGLAGRKAEANKILNELLELNRRHRYVTPPALANVYIGLGDKDQAFFWLEKAYQERSNYLTFLKVFPADDPLRSDPRLDNLLRRMGLAP